MIKDLRYHIMKQRLSLLSNEELQRIIDSIDYVCFDTYNYDKENNKFCPLAIAHNLHNTVENPSDEKITEILSKSYDPVNVLKNIDGNFYKENRKDDLIFLVEELIKKTDI